MSALARYFNDQGKNVSGYDKTRSNITDALIKEGIDVHFQEDINLIPDNPDLVIYTPAIPSSNEEYKNILSKGHKVYKRSEVLGLLSHGKFTIAVAGTHGKTSISSLITHIFSSAEIPVTAFVGGIMKNFNSNYISADNAKIIIVEADEFDRSFLQLEPDIAIINSVDADHLDIYNSKTELLEGFSKFTSKIKKGGHLLLNKKISMETPTDVKTSYYSIDAKTDYFASEIDDHEIPNSFKITTPAGITETFMLNVPGRHNIENALAAISASETFGIELPVIRKALYGYKGVKRRYDIRVLNKNSTYIDDYAHHPREIYSFVSAVKKQFPGKKITGIFQPHLYSRTRDFMEEFARSLELLDQIYLMEIYPAREKPIKDITSEKLLECIKSKNKKLLSAGELLEEIGKHKPELLVSMGAGDIDKLVKPIEKIMKNEKVY